MAPDSDEVMRVRANRGGITMPSCGWNVLWGNIGEYRRLYEETVGATARSDRPPTGNQTGTLPFADPDIFQDLLILPLVDQWTHVGGLQQLLGATPAGTGTLV